MVIWHTSLCVTQQLTTAEVNTIVLAAVQTLHGMPLWPLCGGSIPTKKTTTFRL